MATKMTVFPNFGPVLLLPENIEQCQIQHFHVSRYPVGQGIVVHNVKVIASETNFLDLPMF